jgi:hypothetical protein
MTIGSPNGLWISDLWRIGVSSVQSDTPHRTMIAAVNELTRLRRRLGR